MKQESTPQHTSANTMDALNGPAREGKANPGEPIRGAAKKARGVLNRLTAHRRKKGLPPGTLLYTGEERLEPVSLHAMLYRESSLFLDRSFPAELPSSPLDQFPEILPETLPADQTLWLNVDGIHRVETIRNIGDRYGLHPLMMEDIIAAGQRPKSEQYGHLLYTVLDMVTWNSEAGHSESEQVSLVLGPRFVITFQEHPGDVLDPVRERIRSGKGRIRREGADYLLYCLIDAITDNYFPVLEQLGERIEDLEEAISNNPGEETLHKIHRLKREMIQLRRAVWPLREMVNSLTKSDSSLITETTRLYLRDLYDHTIQIMDTIESFRDLVSGLLDIYLSSLSNRMNSVMKVLTVIATMFIPLTFLAGIYGMNFEHMPELAWRWAYPAFWITCIVILLGMFLYFRKKKWL